MLRCSILRALWTRCGLYPAFPRGSAPDGTLPRPQWDRQSHSPFPVHPFPQVFYLPRPQPRLPPSNPLHPPHLIRLQLQRLLEVGKAPQPEHTCPLTPRWRSPPGSPGIQFILLVTKQLRITSYACSKAAACAAHVLLLWVFNSWSWMLD